MTTWLFDLGNTRLKCAPLRADGRAGEVVALPHREAELADALRELPPGIGAASVASVAAPAVTEALLAQLRQRGVRITLARTCPALAGVRIAYAQPRRLGVDRFLALLAAHARAPRQAVLVCGVGTALTIDLLAPGGEHLGGRIAPSPTLMREALHARAAQLPVAGGRYAEFADDTDDALAAGCQGAALALIERSAAVARERLGTDPVLYLHGGGGEALRPMLDVAHWAPNLVLDGLAIWTAESLPRAAASRPG